ncbi:glycosyltransferase [Candidatus Kaiserbacteria bacterium RIFCSPHIGHO2_02_FULL_54_11b]|uniref:Glycosyltransferase n=2 Tax=Candidatus Kaiseribacteriota TaxID=1752734 RepID=A0A1F6CRB0_9BACT|nr:MAG: glycosyltransferase [Candidatus Kaiserbacteria bacterium RIFCSPHIGHO2_01_FULL_54_36b]OGG64646.1 MAG: glycosyltransferase [Candidatus Kaiserbacteria bacterium RIFCSPHIGHO2_02_FULL_54_11b]
MKNADHPEISVVVPVYGSDNALRELHQRIVATVEKITPSFELILVNDASPDNAWQVIRELSARDKRVRGLNLSRNFGQYPAITAGLQASRGEWVVVMDCDLQDQPEEIEQMYAKAKEGYFAVIGSRQTRHDSRLRSFVSQVFYATLSYLSGTYQDPTLANFGIYHRRVIEAILSLQDHMRYFSVMVRWVGFRTATIPVQHAKRKGGASGYSLRKLLSLATDIILAYTEKPLRLIIKFGVIVTAISGAYLFIIIVRTLIAGTEEPFGLLIGSLWFIFGLLSTMLGVMALYIGKIFDEAKKRPIYIVQEEV